MKTTEEKLVLKAGEFSGAKSIGIVRTINDTFDLGISTDLDQIAQDIQDMLDALRGSGLGDAHSLLQTALSHQRRHATGEERHTPEVSRVQAWRRLGYDDIAEVYEAWYDLAQTVEIVIRNSGTEDAYPEIANIDQIEARLKQLEARFDRLVASLDLDPEDIAGVVCDMFNLELRPDHAFRQYWIDRILASDGFASYAPEMDDTGRPIDEPFGWLTEKYVKALRTHGYTYRFSFWEEPDGDIRGDLWIETDRGRLILTDSTDSVSMKSNFPVQVSNLAGKALFKLRERDVDATGSRRGLLDWLIR